LKFLSYGTCCSCVQSAQKLRKLLFDYVQNLARAKKCKSIFPG
jgi:hypothetical protein